MAKRKYLTENERLKAMADNDAVVLTEAKRGKRGSLILGRSYLAKEAKDEDVKH